MTTVNTWHQDKFLTPGRELWRNQGDFHSIDNFLPSLDGQRLERAPSWGSHVAYPSYLDPVRAAFYDQANDVFTFIGDYSSGETNDVGAFYIAHDDYSKSSAYDTTSTPSAIGGDHKQNACYIFNAFWFIGSNQNVYRASNPYGQAASIKYESGDARAIIPARDTIYLITDTDELLYYDMSSGTFVTLYDTWNPLGGTFLCHFRDSFLLLGYQNDGSVILHRVDDMPPSEMHQTIRVDPHTGQRLPDDANAQYATPWAVYDDDLYFSPGAWISPDDDFEEVPIYRFTGSRVELVDVVSGDVTPHAWGLVKWRERLLLYLLDDGDQRFYVLHNDRFTQFMDAAYTLPTEGEIYSLGGHLAMVTTVGGNDGISLTRYKADGVFTSSWLDMGHPASKKHLSRLACVVSNPATDFQVKIEYRTESGSWTEATEQDNTRHVDAGDLGVEFYLLQIRITFTEEIDPKTYPAVTLESLAATYSYGVR